MRPSSIPSRIAGLHATPARTSPPSRQRPPPPHTANTAPRLSTSHPHPAPAPRHPHPHPHPHPAPRTPHPAPRTRTPHPAPRTPHPAPRTRQQNNLHRETAPIRSRLAYGPPIRTPPLSHLTHRYSAASHTGLHHHRPIAHVPLGITNPHHHPTRGPALTTAPPRRRLTARSHPDPRDRPTPGPGGTSPRDPIATAPAVPPQAGRRLCTAYDQTQIRFTPFIPQQLVQS